VFNIQRTVRGVTEQRKRTKWCSLERMALNRQSRCALHTMKATAAAQF